MKRRKSRTNVTLHLNGNEVHEEYLWAKFHEKLIHLFIFFPFVDEYHECNRHTMLFTLHYSSLHVWRMTRTRVTLFSVSVSRRKSESWTVQEESKKFAYKKILFNRTSVLIHWNKLMQCTSLQCSDCFNVQGKCVPCNKEDKFIRERWNNFLDSFCTRQIHSLPQVKWWFLSY